MDSRDSPSSTSAAAASTGRDGSVGYDVSIVSVASALAKDATLYFQLGKFVECVDVLNQLKQKKQNDPKVLHNFAIAEYFRDCCLDLKKLLEALNSVKNQNAEHARASGESVEAFNLGNKVLVSNRSTASQNSSIVLADEFDASVSMLNIAVIWFHLHEYAKALSVLEPLFQNIEPIDEPIALQICLLFLDVVLACRDASRFAAVLSYMEKAFGVGCVVQGENGNTPQHSANQVSKSSSFQSSTATIDASNSDLAASMNALENPLSRSLSEDTFEYDNVLAEIGGQNLIKPIDHLPSNDLLKAIGYKSISTIDLKLKMQLYKVQFLILTRNLKLAKREVKLAMSIGCGRDSAIVLLLKSELEYARGNHRKAIKLLIASSNQTETATSSIFSNNLGCIYYQLGKYHMASVFFSKALSNCSLLRKEKPMKLLIFSQDKSLLITYNCGLIYLECGKPTLAARCFQKASRVFYRQPLLWLRIAECCLMALQKGFLEASKAPLDGTEIRLHVIGKGKWRQLLMEENGPWGPVDKCEWPKLSLSLARLCLSNALYLLNTSDLDCSKFGSQATSSGSQVLSSMPASTSISSGQDIANSDMKDRKVGTSQEMTHNSLSFYKVFCEGENHMMKQALLANSAYIELEMENPIKALSNASSLLQLPDCSKIYVFLGRIYSAEALCMLNRPKEAAEHLVVYMSEQDDFTLPFHQEDCEQWRIQRNVDCDNAKDSSPEETQEFLLFKPEEARGTLYANLAATYSMKGSLDYARHLATHALILLPNHPQATLTAVYIDLKLGKSQQALARLKECNRISFLPAGLQLDKCYSLSGP